MTAGARIAPTAEPAPTVDEDTAAPPDAQTCHDRQRLPVPH